MDARTLARLATAVENSEPVDLSTSGNGIIVGVTGPPGAGKSSLVDAIAASLRTRGLTAGIIAVDPSSRATGGALLGDRIRMQRHHADPGIFIRSMASRKGPGGLAATSAKMAKLFHSAGFDWVIVETVGVGQDEIEIAGLADVTVVVLTPGMGDDVQAIKAGILEIADVFAINKSDQPGADRTEREIAEERPVPVVRTVATKGIGIEELVSAIEQAPRREKLTGPAYQIDHLGIAVKSIDASLEFYRGQLGMTVRLETVEHERVRVAMLLAGQIELLEASGEDSTIAKFIARRGEGLHHVALRVPNLEALAAQLTASGVRVLGQPQRGAGGHSYLFVHPASTGGVLLELIQK